MTDRCEFSTTRPEGALRQSARGGTTRYRRCKNLARHTVLIQDVTLSWEREREVRCCGIHKRLHERYGWRP